MKEIQSKADMDHFDSFITFVDSCTNETGLNQKTSNKVRLACEEIIINIIKYAYPHSHGDMMIQYELQETDCIKVTFIDQGVPFNPLEKEEPDILTTIHECQIGGLGIFIVKKVMDDVLYERQQGNNILTIKKHLEEKYV